VKYNICVMSVVSNSSIVNNIWRTPWLPLWRERMAIYYGMYYWKWR